MIVPSAAAAGSIATHGLPTPSRCLDDDEGRFFKRAAPTLNADPKDGEDLFKRSIIKTYTSYKEETQSAVPLTTVFTPPSWCASRSLSSLLGFDLPIFREPGFETLGALSSLVEADADCWPPGFKRWDVSVRKHYSSYSYDQVWIQTPAFYFSPGICPSGYYEATSSRVYATGVSTLDWDAMCCPSIETLIRGNATSSYIAHTDGSCYSNLLNTKTSIVDISLLWGSSAYGTLTYDYVYSVSTVGVTSPVSTPLTEGPFSTGIPVVAYPIHVRRPGDQSAGIGISSPTSTGQNGFNQMHLGPVKLAYFVYTIAALVGVIALCCALGCYIRRRRRRGFIPSARPRPVSRYPPANPYVPPIAAPPPPQYSPPPQPTYTSKPNEIPAVVTPPPQVMDSHVPVTTQYGLRPPVPRPNPSGVTTPPPPPAIPDAIELGTVTAPPLPEPNQQIPRELSRSNTVQVSESPVSRVNPVARAYQKKGIVKGRAPSFQVKPGTPKPATPEPSAGPGL
ncbi:hypothetical protein FGG08_000472 [Glutinoglossum americanum]|uniref:Uncharacterized protein n=1 Tax=Glutinoglossum americanum TaxID=1670608 RepID=A0A9P8L3S4_9PEZI|nr:hypothetical protein FGG08_000472 [Glutinoglossum americanum]